MDIVLFMQESSEITSVKKGLPIHALSSPSEVNFISIALYHKAYLKGHCTKCVHLQITISHQK